MAQRPCLILGLIAHAKHNAWVSPVCGSKKGQAVLCWRAVDPPGGVRDGLTGKWHTSETVQEKEKSLFFEEKWAIQKNDGLLHLYFFIVRFIAWEQWSILMALCVRKSILW